MAQLETTSIREKIRSETNTQYGGWQEEHPTS
jgi:hypothetical protein